jgi:hypothetical protein
VCKGEEEDGQGAQEEGQLQGPEQEEGCSTVEVAANVPDAHCTSQRETLFNDKKSLTSQRETLFLK